MPEVFISYSRQDQAIARSFAEEIERAGFRVWWDQAIHPGEAFDEVTERALQAARAVVVLWSKASVDSRWVRAEATQANADGRLLPIPQHRVARSTCSIPGPGIRSAGPTCCRTTVPGSWPCRHAR